MSLARQTCGVDYNSPFNELNNITLVLRLHALGVLRIPPEHHTHAWLACPRHLLGKLMFAEPLLLGDVMLSRTTLKKGTVVRRINSLFAADDDEGLIRVLQASPEFLRCAPCSDLNRMLLLRRSARVFQFAIDLNPQILRDTFTFSRQTEEAREQEEQKKERATQGVTDNEKKEAIANARAKAIEQVTRRRYNRARNIYYDRNDMWCDTEEDEANNEEEDDDIETYDYKPKSRHKNNSNDGEMSMVTHLYRLHHADMLQCALVHLAHLERTCPRLWNDAFSLVRPAWDIACRIDDVGFLQLNALYGPQLIGPKCAAWLVQSTIADTPK